MWSWRSVRLAWPRKHLCFYPLWSAQLLKGSWHWPICQQTHRAHLKHTCKRSWRIRHILAPCWPSWNWSTAWLDLFISLCGLLVSPPATFSHWVLTPNWRMSAGRSQLTSSTQTTRSCWSSLGWLSTTENFCFWKSQPNTELPDSSRQEGQKTGCHLGTLVQEAVSAPEVQDCGCEV